MILGVHYITIMDSVLMRVLVNVCTLQNELVLDPNEHCQSYLFVL